ncbi:MAG TPA: hypothetical protein VFC16_00600 [Nakamurella sp.]|nr:hypothetical protein [Nakamurella sp.]
MLTATPGHGVVGVAARLLPVDEVPAGLSADLLRRFLTGTPK